MITLITLVDAMYIFMFVSFNHVCDWKLPEMATQTLIVPYYYLVRLSRGLVTAPPTEAQLENYNLISLYVITMVSVYAFTILVLCSLILNTFLCIDLYQTVKNPFAKSSGRGAKYTTTALILATGLLALMIVSYYDRNEFWAISPE